MGIKNLSKIIKEYGKTVSLSDYSNKTIVIDTSIYLYKFKYNSTGNEFIKKFLYQINSFMEYNITPIYVFDGIQPEEKKDLLIKRKIIKNNNINSIKISEDDVINLQNTLKYLGIKYYIVNYIDAEAYCAVLNKECKADLVLSNDYDTLIFGCNTLLTFANGNYIEYSLTIILDGLGITMNDLINLSIVCGSDYNCKGIAGVGPMKALKLISKKELEIPEELNYIINIFKCDWDNKCEIINVENIYKNNDKFIRYMEELKIKYPKKILYLKE